MTRATGAHTRGEGGWRARAAALAFVLATAPAIAQDSPVDYPTQIEPLFAARCGGSFCHLGQEASGVDMTSYDALMASVGFQYGRAPVVPFSAATSPLWDKVANDPPEFGDVMPRDALRLPAEEIELIRRWIDEGATPVAVRHLRGDVNGTSTLDITDAIRLLLFLFASGEPPYCAPVADANDDGDIDLADALAILGYIFQGAAPLAPLSSDEQETCDPTNLPPDVEPIGTVVGFEGQTIEFRIVASDPNGDTLRYGAVTGPANLSVETAIGICRWTPGFGEAGDHRVEMRVTDDGVPELTATTTGLIRVLTGNRPPVIRTTGSIYGRELVELRVLIEATDPERGPLLFELVESPEGGSIDPSTGEFVWTPQLGDAGEHTLRCRVTDGGAPAQSSEGTLAIVIVERDSPVNQPPTIPRRDVYRTFPDVEIRLPIDATDPDGDALLYDATELPDGASLDPATGVFAWTPSADDVGPHYVPFTVTDGGVPPFTAESILVFRVSPRDDCVIENCDPALGCAPTQRPLTETCCATEPDVRAAEPVAGCPDGAVMHFGRNLRGFGRMQNCDRLQMILFAQGGANVSLHVEARCINTSQPVNVALRLATADAELIAEEFSVNMQVRNDGFAQRLALFLLVDPFVPILDLEGAEAILEGTLTDVDGTVVREEVRVVLTLRNLDDLPDPDIEDIPAGEVGCVGCHRPKTPSGERVGIEDAHPWSPLTCTDCHGGNANGVTREQAHVSPGAGPQFLRNLSSDQLDAVSLDSIRFVNPGDNRVAGRGCGATNPAAGGTGCHQSIVDSVPNTVMATYAGHYNLPRFLAGSQDRTGIYAAVDRVDPDFDPDTAPEGAVGLLEALREPAEGVDRSTLGACIDIYIPKSCPTCHLSDFGPNNAAGNYRSSGCTACHMLYDDDGLSRSDDPMVSKDFPPHPITHQLTSAIPTNQCTHCHFQGGRIGLAYQGIREGGFPPEKTPENAVSLGVELHAHDRDYYFSDEDSTNAVDETPPDLHFEAGMDCADCHVGIDVHGDGAIYSSERHQVGIRCEDCHGTVRAAIVEDSEDGVFKNARGAPLRHLRRTVDDRIVLTTHREGRELEVPQIFRILESGINHAMTEAMGVNEEGFSHADSMECYTCHTSWRQTCFGCHITIDDSNSALNRTTGETTQGAIAVQRNDYALDFFALGTNHRGRITPLCSSMSIFMSYRDADGVVQYEKRVRTSSDGRRGFGWNPFHHHTVSRVPQNCDRCHPVAEGAGPDNTALLRETYGFGNGRYTFVDGEGIEHDLTAFLTDEGELISEFPHPNTGPVPLDVRVRALSTPVVPHPRNQ